MNASLKINHLLEAKPYLTGIAAHAALYDALKPITYRQRLALILGAKQNQRKPVSWP
jgi:hypothetical protein